MDVTAGTIRTDVDVGLVKIREGNHDTRFSKECLQRTANTLQKTDEQTFQASFSTETLAEMPYS